MQTVGCTDYARQRFELSRTDYLPLGLRGCYLNRLVLSCYLDHFFTFSFLSCLALIFMLLFVLEFGAIETLTLLYITLRKIVRIPQHKGPCSLKKLVFTNVGVGVVSLKLESE